jgi:uncharacterized protein (DUF697 family)
MPTRFLNFAGWSPMQLIGGIITALIAALLTFSLSWVHNISAATEAHESKIAVLDNRAKHTEEDVTEIKASQRRIEDKLDRTLERRK